MGADVDGLACRLHQPTNYSKQTKVQSLLTDIILYRCPVKAGVALGDVKPSRVDALPCCRHALLGMAGLRCYLREPMRCS
jgi:hypothetical protein